MLETSGILVVLSEKRVDPKRLSLSSENPEEQSNISQNLDRSITRLLS